MTKLPPRSNGCAVPPPVITTITPPGVSAAAGPATMTITGTGFVPGSTVWINGLQQSSGVTVNSPTSITLAGWDPVVATNYTFQVKNENGDSEGTSYTVVA